MGAAHRRSELLRIGDAKGANKEYDRLHNLKDRFRTLPDKGNAALRRIGLTNDLEVRLLAAAALLALDEPLAVGLLTEIAKSESLFASFTAEMTLREWAAGNLRQHWS